jgi:hypothetical protein
MQWQPSVLFARLTLRLNGNYFHIERHDSKGTSRTRFIDRFDYIPFPIYYFRELHHHFRDRVESDRVALRRFCASNISLQGAPAGTLTTTSGSRAAGIGPGAHSVCGVIDIANVTYTTSGGVGIGSSFGSSVLQRLVIRGEAVSASGSLGAGIGAGPGDGHLLVSSVFAVGQSPRTVRGRLGSSPEHVLGSLCGFS